MKYIWIFSLVLLTFMAQAQKGRKLYQEDDVIIFKADSVPPTPPKKTVDEQINVTTPIIKENTDIEKNHTAKKEIITDSIIRKESYNIGLILPFNNDIAWGSMAAGIKEMTENGVKKWSIPKETKISIDFYNGLKMAVANLKNSSVKINLQVYDDKKNEETTKQILADSSLKKMDVIIGPAHTQNAKLVADFCKENHIYNFSPFSTSKYVAVANPYHFKLAPTLDMHLKAMVDYFVEKYTFGTIIVLCRPTEEERSYAAAVYDYVSLLNLSKPKNEQLICDTLVNGTEDFKKPLSSFYTGNHTFVLAPSFNEGFINTAIDKVGGSAATVDFFGFPSWAEYDNVNYTALTNSAAKITKISFGDTSIAEVRTFNKNFKDTHGYNPEENVYLGYDVMMFTADVLTKFGLSIKENFQKIDYKGLATSFKFVPVKYSKGVNGTDLDLYENTQLNFLKFENYDLVPLDK